MTRANGRRPAAEPSRTWAADRRRSEIVTRAAELFDSAGYDRTSMDDIAKAVQIAKPTLYHYFSSKDEILFFIHEEFIDLLMTEHLARAELGLTAEAELHELIADILGLMQTHRGHVRVFFEHHRDMKSARRAIIARKRKNYEDVLASVLVRGMTDGEFRRLDPKLTSLAIFGMCNWAYQWYSVSGQLPARQIAGLFADLVQNGLRSTAGS
jgi:AcrR family transcriptional regulator